MLTKEKEKKKKGDIPSNLIYGLDAADSSMVVVSLWVEEGGWSLRWLDGAECGGTAEGGGLVGAGQQNKIKCV